MLLFLIKNHCGLFFVFILEYGSYVEVYKIPKYGYVSKISTEFFELDIMCGLTPS